MCAVDFSLGIPVCPGMGIQTSLDIINLVQWWTA